MTFKKKFRGYNAKEVDKYIEETADDVEMYLTQLVEAEIRKRHN